MAALLAPQPVAIGVLGSNIARELRTLLLGIKSNVLFTGVAVEKVAV